MSVAISVKLVTKNNKPFLQFDFPGYLDAQSATKAIESWKTTMSQNAGSRVSLIYNCIDMIGFETEARRNWQSAMNSLKNQIGDIWIVSGNVFILGAAKTMGVLTGFNIKVARNLEEVSK